MGRLDELDLSLKLSRAEEADRLAAAQERLLQLRLHLAGLVGDMVRPGPGRSSASRARSERASASEPRRWGRAPEAPALSGRNARRRVAVLAALAVVSGCSQSESELPRGCLQGQRAVTGALRSAPGAVSLRDGTRLSACVQHANSGSELQEVGLSYVNAASTLAEAVPGSDAAALQLGYLVGATRRGAGATNGTGFELLRRIELSVGVEGPPVSRRAAYARGLAAGRRLG